MKKIMTTALLAMSLVSGILLEQSIFNEAQAKGKAPETAGCLMRESANSLNYCCSCGGNTCFGVCC